MEVRVPFATLLKVAAAAALVLALWYLKPFVELVLLSLLCAITLAPAVRWFERRMTHGVAVISVAIIVVASITIFWALVLPPLTRQISVFVTNFHEIFDRLVARTANSGVLHQALAQAAAWPHSPEAHELFKHSWTWGLALIDGVTGLMLLLILALYLLQDGPGLYAWLLSYVPRRYRAQVGETVPEVSRVIRAYVRGQVITSVLCGAYAWAALSLMHVPAALPLAVLAGICDILPVLGIVISGVPAAALALTVSPGAALGTLGLYLLYHGIENYVLVPRIYGRQLRLSTLTVLVSLIVGGTLFGVIGAILALPIVAAYPIVERRWLGGYLGRDTIEDHAALDAPHPEAAERAAQQVIEGEPPVEGHDPQAPRH